MKSSAPQTTMSISLAPMIQERPPEGAQTQQELYEQAGGKEGTGVGFKAFCERLQKRKREGEQGLTRGKFTHNGRADVVFWWMEVK